MKTIILNILIISCLLIYNDCELKSQVKPEYLINNIILTLDSCLSSQIKENIKISIKIDFIKFGSCNNISTWNNHETNEYFNCFRNIDTLIHIDTNYTEYFSDLLDHFNVLINTAIRKCYYNHLNGITFDFAREIDSLRGIKLQRDSISNAWKVADSIKGFYIPKDLNDALNQFDKILTKEDIKRFTEYANENEASGNEHLRIGLSIRNCWKLGGSRLHGYFAALGVQNHDRISSIILKAWYRKLHNQSTNIDDLLIEARKYEAEDKIHALEYKNRYKRKDTKENITEPNKIK